MLRIIALPNVTHGISRRASDFCGEFIQFLSSPLAVRQSAAKRQPTLEMECRAGRPSALAEEQRCEIGQERAPKEPIMDTWDFGIGGLEAKLDQFVVQRHGAGASHVSVAGSRSTRRISSSL